MKSAEPNHYATLGLDRRCTLAQIRAAYRLLAKQHHPDLNPDSPEAVRRTQALNAAHEVLSDPERRRSYDDELDAAKKPAPPQRAAKLQRNICQDAHLPIEDFLRGTKLKVLFSDPASPSGPESYELVVPPGTAPGTRFCVPRAEGGFVQVRLRARPGFRFKVRGSDLRCDLKIKPERAAQGGTETIPGVTGAPVRVPIPRGIGRNEIVRVPGEGLPKPRGGRGDLLVRVAYRIEVRVTRAVGR